MKFFRQEAIKGIDQDPNAPSQLKDILNGVLDVVDDTIENGQVDMGGTVVLGPRSLKFAGGGYVADGKALAKAFQRVIELAKNEPDLPDVQFHADEPRGVSFHKLVVEGSAFTSWSCRSLTTITKHANYWAITWTSLSAPAKIACTWHWGPVAMNC
jgi:hypothetical protein